MSLSAATADASPDFAPGEIAWLAEEALRVRLRAAGRPDAAPPALVTAAHRREPSFARLAAHPRMLRAARARLGGEVALDDAALWFGGAPTRVTSPAARLVVDLGPAPERDARLLFVADYRRCRAGEAPLADEPEDCLWPAAAFCAG
jgi:hypothetical protein